MTIRRAISMLTAAVALTACLGSAATAPDAAQAAAPCKAWHMPTKTVIVQSNGFKVSLWLDRSTGWRANYVQDDRDGYLIGNRITRATGKVRFQPAATDAVRFTITWSNDTAGVYTGVIDADGFVSGTTVDRWNRSSRAHWRLRDLATCVRR